MTTPSPEHPCLRVLLVEDNPGDADLVREALRGAASVEIVHVEDLAQALARLTADPIDVVLLDLSLPDASGLESVETLRRAAPEVPIVVLTGSADDTLGARAVQAGAQDYLVKGKADEWLMLRAMRYATERHQLQSALRVAVIAREDFVSVASHELRTPLTALELQVDSLQCGLAGIDDPRLDQPRATCAKLAKLTARMERLVEDLLDVNRLTTAPLLLDREPIDLRALVEGVAERFADQASNARCALSVVPGAAVVGLWDGARVARLLRNLLANALKYGGGKPVLLELSAHEGWAEVSVRDEGIGVAPADAARIFERFERAVSSRRYGGLGVGLHIAKEIAVAHGGSIDVVSELGQGARFVVRLPLSPAAPRTAPTRPSAPPELQ